MLRLACRGLDRPWRLRPVAVAMTARDAVISRGSRSGGKRTRLSDRAAHDVDLIEVSVQEQVAFGQGSEVRPLIHDAAVDEHQVFVVAIADDADDNRTEVADARAFLMKR